MKYLTLLLLFMVVGLGKAGAQTELKAGNNQSLTQGTVYTFTGVNSNGYDLKVTSFTYTVENGKLTFHATIKNVGNQRCNPYNNNASEKLGIAFKVDGAQVAWNDQGFAGLDPGAEWEITSYNVSASQIMTWDVTSGDHTLSIVVDDNSRFTADLNSANNEGSLKINVSGTTVTTTQPFVESKDGEVYYMPDFFEKVSNGYKFLGKNGKYNVKYKTDDNDSYSGRFLELWPLTSSGSDEKKDDAFDVTTMTGPLWASGGRSTFRLPQTYVTTASGKGWEAATADKGTKYSYADNFTPLADTGDKKYYLTLTTGEQWGQPGVTKGSLDPQFKIYHMAAYTYNPNGNENDESVEKYHEFRGYVFGETQFKDYDLCPENITYEPSVVNGKAHIRFSTSIKNVGVRRAPAGSEVGTENGKLGVVFTVTKDGGTGLNTWNDGAFGGLEPNATKTFTANGGADGATTGYYDLEEGNYTVKVNASDVDTYINGDRNKDNNTGTIKITVAADGSVTTTQDFQNSYSDDGYNLKVTDIIINNGNDFKKDDNVSFTVKVKNVGTKAFKTTDNTYSTKKLAIRFSVNDKNDGSDKLWNDTPVNEDIEPNAEKTFTTDETGSSGGQWTVTSGSVKISVKIDEDDKFTGDLNKDDNQGYIIYNVPDDGSNATLTKAFTNNAEEATTSGEHNYLMELKDPEEFDFLQVSTGPAKSNDQGFNNGNIETRYVAPLYGVSDTNLGTADNSEGTGHASRYLPSGYTLQFSLDFNGMTDLSKEITTLSVKRLWNYHKYTAATNVLGNTADTDPSDDYTVSLWNENAGHESEILTLRDALRFELGILYADQLTTDYFLNGDKRFIIKGNLTEEDMKFLALMVQHGVVHSLDLSEATVYNDVIPEGFAKGASGFTSITLPKSFQKSGSTELTIGKQAFADCSKLRLVENSNALTLDVQEQAFINCGSLSSTVINGLLKYFKDGKINNGVFWSCTSNDFKQLIIPAQITTIDENAFNNDTQLTDIYVPTGISETTAVPAGVGTFYTPMYIPSANNVETGTIEAEYFNVGEGAISYYNVKKSKVDGDATKNRDNVKHNEYGSVVYLEEFSKNDGTESFDYLNYTFRCLKAGNYKVTVRYAAKDIETDKPYVALSFDKANSTSIDDFTKVMIENATGTDGTAWHTFADLTIGYVNLTEGMHVMKFHAKAGLNIDRFDFELVSSTDGLTAITSGDNKTSVTLASSGSAVATCANANTFDGLSANNCELHFFPETYISQADAVDAGKMKDRQTILDADDATSNWAKYRESGQNGWLHVLTKNLSEDDAAYNCVKQRHADFNLTKRTIVAGWNTFVAPFHAKFSRVKNVFGNNAAYYFTDVVGNVIRMTQITADNLNTYQKDKNSMADAASDPYLIDYYPMMVTTSAKTSAKFEDVDLLTASPVVLAYGPLSGTASAVKMNGTLVERSKAHENQVDNPYLLQKQGDDFYMFKVSKGSFKGYRSWFDGYTRTGETSTPSGAASYKVMFLNGNEPTAIATLNADGSIAEPADIYSIDGTLVRSQAVSTDGLPKGIYIKNGKKIVVK